MLNNFMTSIYAVLRAALEVLIQSNLYIAKGIMLPLISNTDLEKILNKMTDGLIENKSTLDNKIEEARVALTQTSRVINELELELIKNVESLESVKRDYEKFSQLAQVEKDAASAVLENIAETLDAGKSKERWISIAISFSTGLIIFVLGIWLGPFITNILNVGK